MATKAVTIAAMIGELIETHMANCAADNPNDDIPHVISEAHKTKAFITSLANADLGAEQLLVLELDDGTSFNIRVEEA